MKKTYIRKLMILAFQYSVSFFWGREINPKYISNQIIGHFPLRRLEGEKFDLVFVLHEEDFKWILGGICEEIARYFEGRYCFATDFNNLPNSNSYFFVHFIHFRKAILANKSFDFWRAKKVVWHTHQDKKHRITKKEMAFMLNYADKIICANSYDTNLLTQFGVSPKKLTFVLGGADPILFQYKKRDNKFIGLCTAYYPRKNPELIYSVIRNCPEYNFLLLGRDWEKFEKFEEMQRLSNFSYLEASYDEYPTFYERISVFLSLSKLEGGPIPLIEAMMSNCIPISTNTGFAPDLIRHGENGYIIDAKTATAPEVKKYLKLALENSKNIRDTVINYNWENFSKAVASHL